MTRPSTRLAWMAGLAVGLTHAVVPATWARQMSVVNSPHNLSAGGPGTVRAASENQVCIFCHAPHNASPIQPLWNRSMPVDAYLIYTSRALDARPGQPTGTSKMCLSCHDGTIALGAVVSRSLPIQMLGGVTTIPNGHGNIGTDLRDDHPISFRYDTALASADTKLRNPASIPHELKLDANGELQCTTCHDAHNNARGSFLVMDNLGSAMCISCHNMGQTTISAHQDCSACHQPHTAPSGPYLLRGDNVTRTCNRCHDGATVEAPNIATELMKAYIHDKDDPVDPPDPQSEHTTCTSCHDPHTMSQGSGIAPGVHPNFGRVAGVNTSGSPVTAATTEAEVCYKCHASGASVPPAVSRRIVQNNTSLEFSPSAVSFHPVNTQGRNMDVPSLRPGWTTASLVYCSDCHGSDSAGPPGGGLAGSSARGIHGSNLQYLLRARYDTEDYTSESASAYALCYACHDRANILDDQSFKGHKRHIVEERTPCSACHDAHGIASGQGTVTNNSHLINFATEIVQPNSQGRLEYRDLGRFSGECFLSCHGKNHSPEKY